MKHSIIGICVVAVFVPEIVLAGNCGNGQGGGVGNPHCGQAIRVPATSLAGVRPAQNTKPPTQIGGIIPDPHNTVLTPIPQPKPPALQTPPPTVVIAPPQVLPPQKTPPLVPPQPPAQQVPMPIAVVAPPQVLPPQQTPMLVPPKPPAQQIPTPTAVVAPSQVLPPQQTPMLVPPQPVVQTPPQIPTAIPQPVLPPQQTPILVPPRPVVQTPQQVPTAIPRPVTTPSVLAGSGAIHGNALLVHAPDTPKPPTSGRIAETAAYTLEFIEPGLQSRKVKVYRTNDAAEQVYKDTIPLDQGGFQIIVVGTRNPDYIH
jgi:hypothetical protein